MRVVIDADVAARLAERRASPPERLALLAPTLMRSDVLARLYARVRAGEMGERDAAAALDHLRSLRVRLLGDRVLQRRAWEIARRFGWPDTYLAEYVALAQLQADAFATADAALAEAVGGLVPVMDPRELFEDDRT